MLCLGQICFQERQESWTPRAGSSVYGKDVMIIFTDFCQARARGNSDRSDCFSYTVSFG